MPWEPVWQTNRADGTRPLFGYVRDDGEMVVRGESGWWFGGRRFELSTEAMEAADLAQETDR